MRVHIASPFVFHLVTSCSASFHSSRLLDAEEEENCKGKAVFGCGLDHTVCYRV